MLLVVVMAFFSITIPAYKSRFLSEAIESCLTQAYRDFELIIVDDASPEDLESITNQYNDPRIRYYRNERNCGALNVVDNWNICLNYCKGDYIICMGDDDRLMPQCLEEYVRLINKYPNLDVYHAWTELIDENGIVIKQLSQRPEYQGCMEMIWNHWNGDTQYIGDFCFRTESLRKEGGFFKQPLAWASDDITVARAAANGGIANTQEVAFQYRENPLTISRDGNNAIKIEAKLLERVWFRHFFDSTLLADSDSEQQYFQKLNVQFDCHYRLQVLQYIKKYMHESFLNIIPIIKCHHHYGIKIKDILLLYLKVIKYDFIH